MDRTRRRPSQCRRRPSPTVEVSVVEEKIEIDVVVEEVPSITRIAAITIEVSDDEEFCCS
ncbi:hypothetical protein MtrunA17_Chr8g0389381 [Medicago truncatula]|uniref:Uncharacterized protein n=1 Tax=Medicago truncatula TaxID=3880 RepID=A0A396GSR2_MEDTR|nr:hypothetical protein MtrunA17_Chr8g0389381 [Medicago truncatula]